MTSLQKKIEEVKELYKNTKPIRRTAYTTFVYGYGPFDDGDDDYIDMVYGTPGQQWGRN